MGGDLTEESLVRRRRNIAQKEEEEEVATSIWGMVIGGGGEEGSFYVKGKAEVRDAPLLRIFRTLGSHRFPNVLRHHFREESPYIFIMSAGHDSL